MVAQRFAKGRTYKVGHSSLRLEFGDITRSNADVIVSSDDSYLTMGGGVSAAILRAAGQSMFTEVWKKVPAALGDVVVTGAGALPAKHIFHAITIGEGSASPSDIVANATRRAIHLLTALKLSSIAFPAIGAGAARYSYDDVAARMAQVIVEELHAASVPLSATIYLFDRFGKMEQIDHLPFFEEFAARVKGLPAAVASAQTESPVKKFNSGQVTNAGALEDLLALDKERNRLEERLSQFGDALPQADVAKIALRLREVQELRLALFAKVSPRPASAVSVFISYSHADDLLRRELDKHLKVLERQGIIRAWHDRMIGAGAEWAGAIDARLEDARVILLLISADFIASEYCYDVEMRRALARHEAREALVVPVMLRAVALTGTPFAKLQALPRDAKPVQTWADRDSAFVDIADGLRNAIQDLVGHA